jgi:uncharacterized protein
MKAKRVVLPGGSGFLGQSLARDLAAEGFEPVTLTRSPKEGQAAREVAWDGKTVGPWAAEIDGAVAVVNFTGRSVNCRYTEANKREIVGSRVDSVKVLGEAVRKAKAPPGVFVQAGSLAIFGDSGDAVMDEGSPLGEGFSPEVCKIWEKTFAEAAMPTTRKVYLRIGFALGPGGGALEPLVNITKGFLGGSVGSGQQFISWIHLDDLNRMFLRAIEHDDMEGIYNATGPTPLRNAEFMKTLRGVLGRPWSPPTPSFAVRIGAMFMSTEAELALTGRRGVPKRLLDEGFAFQHTDLREALGSILGSKG